MIRKKRTFTEVGVNMTPLIDMTFLLLIFFMVTSKLSKEQIKMDVALPQSRVSKIPDGLSERDIINVDADGNYYVGNNKVTKDQLKKHLTERFKNAPPLKVYIRADQKTPYKTMKVIHELAAEAGAGDILYGTYRK